MKADDVKKFLDGQGVRVIVSTYHSAERVAEALRASGRRADLLICDEAHRTTGRATKRDAKPLNDAIFPARRRLFLTATPRLLGEKRDAAGDLVPAGSMDDERLYGKVAYRLEHTQAVAEGIVSPLRLVFLDASAAYKDLARKELDVNRGFGAARPIPRRASRK